MKDTSERERGQKNKSMMKFKCKCIYARIYNAGGDSVTTRKYKIAVCVPAVSPLYALILGDCLAPSPRIIIRYRNTRPPPTSSQCSEVTKHAHSLSTAAAHSHTHTCTREKHDFSLFHSLSFVRGSQRLSALPGRILITLARVHGLI